MLLKSQHRLGNKNVLNNTWRQKSPVLFSLVAQSAGNNEVEEPLSDISKARPPPVNINEWVTLYITSSLWNPPCNLKRRASQVSFIMYYKWILIIFIMYSVLFYTSLFLFILYHLKIKFIPLLLFSDYRWYYFIIFIDNWLFKHFKFLCENFWDIW